MERKGEASNAWRPMEREGEASNVWRPMEGEDKASFVPLSTPPLSNLLRPLYFSFDLMVLLYHSSSSLFTHSLLFSLAYKLQSRLLMSQVPHTFIVNSI